jgi:molybdopterin biosynthesis enzyme
MLSSVVESNAYMVVKEDVSELKEGQEVEVIMIGDIP